MKVFSTQDLTEIVADSVSAFAAQLPADWELARVVRLVRDVALDIVGLAGARGLPLRINVTDAGAVSVEVPPAYLAKIAAATSTAGKEEEPEPKEEPKVSFAEPEPAAGGYDPAEVAKVREVFESMDLPVDKLDDETVMEAWAEIETKRLDQQAEAEQFIAEEQARRFEEGKTRAPAEAST